MSYKSFIIRLNDCSCTPWLEIDLNGDNRRKNMKKIGIIGAMELEIKLLLDNMELNKFENISGFSYY